MPERIDVGCSTSFNGRATNYRANHYRMMSSFGNHIVALDYRGYGDSTGVPSVQGVVHDVLHVFNIIRQACPDNPITVWGHSMGTGVALWTLNHLFQSQTSNAEENRSLNRCIDVFVSIRSDQTFGSRSRSTLLQYDARTHFLSIDTSTTEH